VPPRAPLPFDAFDLSDEDIRQRFRWARRNGHPRYPWPDVPMADWARACRAVADATARVLADGTASPGVHRLDASAGRAALSVAAFTTGMGPLFGRWLDQGTLETDGDVAEVLELHLRHGRARADRTAALLERITETLRPVAAPIVLLKGAHTSRYLFPEPGTRPMADLDVLVGAGLFPQAEEALRRAGFRRTGVRHGPLRSSWDPPDAQQSGSTAIRSLHLCHGHQALSVDLHASLARDFYGVHTVDLGLPGERDLVRVPGAGPEALGLSAPLLFLVLATHASEDLHNLQLVRLAEMALLGRCLSGTEGGWQDTLGRARRAGALRFSHPAVTLAERLVPGSIDPGYLAAAREDSPSRLIRVVERLEPGVAQALDRLSLEERLLWARGPREVCRRLLRMLVPDSAGGSLRVLWAIYASRFIRLVRGRVRLGSARRKGEE